MKKFLPKSITNPQGFTLIELLVVISIIAILSVIGMMIYSGVQKNAREARRRADIDAISDAWESDYATNNRTAYQALSGSMFSTGVIPLDPTNTGTYIYTTTLVAGPPSAYCACALLESTGKGNSTNSACAFATGNYYCRKNRQ